MSRTTHILPSHAARPPFAVHTFRQRLRRAFALFLVAVLGAAAFSTVALADGDPGSDVLVYQDLFVGSDAGLSVAQQVRLGGLLKASAHAGFPLRVAIIAGPEDLGAVTGLWRKPTAYARFLGIELSLAYRQRLLVVMPNGFGFNYPGHRPAAEYRQLSAIPIGSGTTGLMTAAKNAVIRLASAAHITLPATSSQPAGSAVEHGSRSTGGTAAVPRGSMNPMWVILALAAAALVVATVVIVRRSGRVRRPSAPPRRDALSAVRGRHVVAGAGLVVSAMVVLILLVEFPTTGQTQRAALAFNPALDPGTAVSGTAPDFTLSDQFGQPVSLRSFRGKVVVLAFNDSECTTICPLTTSAMLQAKAMLGTAGSRVQLLGIDANPAAMSLEDVWSYSELHGMLRAWRFLTGSLSQLQRVWKAYAVEAAIDHGLITHTPALFVIGPQGEKAKVYITQQSYAAVGQLGKLIAQEASSLLPDHPAVHSNVSYAPIAGIPPQASIALPRAGGGTIAFGPGRSARLSLFFATWDREITGLGGHLVALNGYSSSAARLGLPPLTAVDEASVEPSATALSGFLGGLPHQLSYPVAIDTSGRVADGYEVQGQPWFVLTSSNGRILWYWQVATGGWPSQRSLVANVRAALALGRVSAPSNAGTVAQQLAGSPGPLADLHQEASRVLGQQPALMARIRSLKGYPIVVNAWASWCVPCRSEFGLFASASGTYGRHVAFLGADTDDSAGDAGSFLAQHPVSYPSYETTTGNLGSLAVVEGLPTTIFINRAGKVAYVHTGQYDSQGSLDLDIGTYALGG
jgi:cytochrome oxidase Cu insertion factor (SCO1/SenC/PrrC family)/thiol-disulfide isomerase/thioredoxin